MATKKTATKATKAAKPTAAEKKKAKEISEAARINKTRTWSVIISMIGVLVAFLTYIEGAPLHNILWGLFGFSVILVAPIIVYVAVMMALDRSKSAVVVKIIQGVILLLLISPAFELISCLINDRAVYDGANFTDVLTYLYNNGVNMQGGGAMSIFVGMILIKICAGKTIPALLLLVFFILFFIMLLTNITIVDVFRFIVKIFKAIREKAKEREN